MTWIGELRELIRQWYRYIEVDPRSFMEGDMVEAHLSFLVIRLSAKRQLNRALSPASVDNHRMLVVLRGLTRLARNASPVSCCELTWVNIGLKHGSRLKTRI